VQAQGAVIQSQTLELAKRVQGSVPGFNYFSGFNDRFHQENAPGSQHVQGKAFDFTLQRPPTREEAAKIMQDLYAMGAVKVIDEYNNPSRGSTGGHFHVQAMAKGGITQGPSVVGEAGPEAVVPLPDGKSIPVQFDARKSYAYGRLKAKDDREFFLGGLSTHGAVNMGPLSTDRKLTDMIMQRLGLEDLRSKIMINQSGIGLNTNIAGVDFGSRIGGGLAQEEITARVANLVEEGIPLQGALQQTLSEFRSALDELVKSQGGGGEGMMALMYNLVELQRQQNATSRQMLQAATN